MEYVAATKNHYCNRVGYNVFLDDKNILGGEEWGNTIKNNIQKCDIFVLIVTAAALNSPEIDKEIRVANDNNKLIIPCIHDSISDIEVKEKWDFLAVIQNIKFNQDTYEDLFNKLKESISKKPEIEKILLEKKKRKRNRKIIFIVIGVTIFLFVGVLLGSTYTKAEYKFDHAFGSRGTDRNQFESHSSIATDSYGSIYVVDTDNHRIQRFGTNGSYLTSWGSLGNGTGQFNFPEGITIDSNSNVYVAAEPRNNRIQKFGTNGSYLTSWGSLGNGTGQFNYSQAIAVDSQYNVYIVDSNNNRIQKFSPDGKFIMEWGSFGINSGEFSSRGISIDSQDNVYVADTKNNRIQTFVPVSNNFWEGIIKGSR